MDFCQNTKLNGLTAEIVGTRKYHICGKHFLPTDYKTKQQGTRRSLKKDAIPSERGPIICDSSGLLISPIKPRHAKIQARHIGLLSSEDYKNIDDDDINFEYRDYDKLMAEVDSELQGSSEDKGCDTRGKKLKSL